MYNDYGYSSGYSASSDFETVFAGILAGLGIFLVIILVMAILAIIGMWKTFKKAGYDGWLALIPCVNIYIMLKITGLSEKWLLLLTYGSVIMFIPVLGWIAYFAMMIYYLILVSVSMARSFGKSNGFAVGLALLGPIFYFILGIKEDKYLGPKPMNDFIFKNNGSSNNNVNSNVTTTTTGPVTGTKFCIACGNKVDQNTKFCASCGKEVN